MDKNDSEGTESVESKKRHDLHKEFLKKSGSYFINYVYIVLFLEKEPKHPLVKFCAAITLLIIICLGVWQVIEARMSNILANESLRVSTDSLKLSTDSLKLSNESLLISNKMAAYSLLSDPNVSNEFYVSSYNLLSNIEDNITFNIKDRKINDNLRIDFLGSDKYANVKLINSSVFGNYSKLKKSYFGLYDSWLFLNVEGSSYSAFGLYNSELFLKENCDGAVFLSDYNEKCSKSEGDMVDVKLRGNSSVSLIDQHNSNVFIETLDPQCYEFSNLLGQVFQEEFGCDKVNLKENQSDYSRLVNVFNSNDVVITNYVEPFSDKDYKIGFYFIRANNVIFNDFGGEVGRDFTTSNSSIKYNSRYIKNAFINISKESYIVFGFVSLNDIDKTLKRKYLEEIAYNCVNNMEGLKTNLEREFDGFFKGFSCQYFERDDILHEKTNEIDWRFFEGLDQFVKINSDKINQYRTRFQEFFLQVNLFLTVSDNNISSMVDSEIIIGKNSSSLILNYYIDNVLFYFDEDFSVFKIKDSVVSESSRFYFDFSKLFYFDPSRQGNRVEIFCNKVKSLFKNVDNFKGTIITRSNVVISPSSACNLDDVVFQERPQMPLVP